MIQLTDITKTYESKSGSHQALKGVDLRVERGEIYGIIGRSGAGKSTLVRCINLLERPTVGRVVIDGTDVTGYQGAALRELRSNIGMIFQRFSLFQQRTVLQNVMFPLEVQKVPRSKRRARALELLELVDLAGMENRYPSELSGGQMQRVAIARALSTAPHIMLCDEATSALDTRTAVSVLDLLRRLNDELGMTTVLITHSLSVARRACDHVAVIDDGLIVERGTVAQVFENPQAQATRELIQYDEEG